jgi:hypothetical protein
VSCPCERESERADDEPAEQPPPGPPIILDHRHNRRVLAERVSARKRGIDSRGGIDEAMLND